MKLQSGAMVLVVILVIDVVKKRRTFKRLLPSTAFRGDLGTHLYIGRPSTDVAASTVTGRICLDPTILSIYASVISRNRFIREGDEFKRSERSRTVAAFPCEVELQTLSEVTA